MDLTLLCSEHTVWDRTYGGDHCKRDRDVEMALWEPPGKKSFFLEVIFHPRGRSRETGTECPMAPGVKGVGQGPEGALETT